jgi:hypothetical protein
MLNEENSRQTNADPIDTGDERAPRRPCHERLLPVADSRQHSGALAVDRNQNRLELILRKGAIPATVNPIPSRKRTLAMGHDHTSGLTGTKGGKISVLRLGSALSTFFALSYLICIAGYLAFPDAPIPHATLSAILPGFTLLTWRSFLLGLAESIAFGWYVGLGFGSLYNVFAFTPRRP